MLYVRPRPARPSRRPPGRPRTVAPALRVRPCLTRRGAGARALWKAAACALPGAARAAVTGTGPGDTESGRRAVASQPPIHRLFPSPRALTQILSCPPAAGRVTDRGPGCLKSVALSDRRTDSASKCDGHGASPGFKLLIMDRLPGSPGPPPGLLQALLRPPGR